MIARRPFAVAVLSAAALTGAAATALAHSEVESTSPRAGGTATTAVTKVTVTFSGPMRTGTIRVTGPGGAVVSRGRGGRDPRNVNRLTVALKGGLKAGSYKASWTSEAADGHDQRGSFRFKLRAR
ncbi:copper resistance protein CopC [Svornostia abyssi]|uniref:Copper resistance protein CopC n=1 Tax=Svornostia abyssi TaxID=2898438 RepID=A0ABY5PN15_9ACTN|nr:copper resistance protein CopC [Parviterribacteraceae bacterium J379]